MELTDKKKFIKSLLEDVKALEYMLQNDWFEKGITRIGAEQELVLIDTNTYKPSLVGPEVKEDLNYEWLVNELGKFNLELNLQPRIFNGNCFQAMESELRRNLFILKSHLAKYESDYLLTGILPTMRKYHLGIDNLTPKPRYLDLMSSLDKERGSTFELRLVGIDELFVRHDTPLLEAANTSFQVHLQVAASDFVKYYNNALALTAPCIAFSANSPIVFGKRLWHETRIALFQQAVDTRKTYDHMRQMSARVSFGDDWIYDSILDIFKEDIARFRTLLWDKPSENAMELIHQSKVPKLKSLQLHNSTVYRWNRPCYGISDTGKPHLRIENRIFPAGPSIMDEMANAVLWLGAMEGFPMVYSDIRNFISFEDIRDNFGKAARFGIDTKFTWIKDKKITARDLILEELIPIARQGLLKMNIETRDIDNYLGIITERTQKHMNGARWMLRSFTALSKKASNDDEALSILTATIYRNQNIPDHPIHDWKEPELEDNIGYKANFLIVADFMETNLFTAQPGTLAELVTTIMEWKHFSNMPVEDADGNLVGIVNLSDALTKLKKSAEDERSPDLLVSDVMLPADVTIAPEETIKNARRLMQEHHTKCLPVIKGNELVGLLTESNFQKISKDLI